ncbi:nuclear pore protein 84/107 [Gautieria morchelliformis]|nr:nuclear pore protein 84/107 [Gautieria morchelliformis]
MTDSLYSSCAQIFYAFQSSQGDISAVLHPTHGFAPRMRDACQKALIEVESRSRDLTYERDDLEFLRLERDTWDLLQHIYGARKTSVSPLPTARALLHENPYATPMSLANHIIHHSPILSELIITREWLQDTAPPPQIIETATTYWNFTKLSLMHARRSGIASTQAKLVKELDPDVVNRESGAVLAAEDAAYEKALAHSLYTYIRAGQGEQAMELCRSARRPWRAAALQGYKLFDWTALSRNFNLEDDAMEQDPNVQVSGNKRRRLWKASCTLAALNNKLSVSDRLLHAALAPSPQTLGVLTKEGCKTWEDHLWARISALCEEKLSEAMGRLGPNFWEYGTKAFNAPAATEEVVISEHTTLDEVRRVLGKMSELNVEEGPGAGDPFHVTQLRVVLDQADSLLDDFGDYLGSSELPHSAPEYARLTRFFSHLCLFFDHIEVPVSPLASQKILEAYVSVLEDQGQTDLIAQYAAALGDNAVSRYALFLAELPVSTSSHERRGALLRAHEFGLDISRVALGTADMCMDRAFKALPSLLGPYPPVSSDPRKLSDAEQALINATDWLTFQESTYRPAVVRINSVLRYFLGKLSRTGNLHACHELRERRPTTLRDDPPGQPSDRYESLHFERFFIAWAALGLADHRGSQLTRPMANSQTREQEINLYETTLKRAQQQVLDLLTHGWLQLDQLGETSDATRWSELARVREIYIPELVIRLHRCLYDSRTVIPRNIKSALMLANIVADSRYELYDAFQNPYGNRLGEYLQCVKEAILGGLEGGSSDPFRVVAA